MIHSARLADIIIHNYAVDEMKLMKKEKKNKKVVLVDLHSQIFRDRFISIWTQNYSLSLHLSLERWSSFSFNSYWLNLRMLGGSVQRRYKRWEQWNQWIIHITKGRQQQQKRLNEVNCDGVKWRKKKWNTFTYNRNEKKMSANEIVYLIGFFFLRKMDKTTMRSTYTYSQFECRFSF